MRDDRPRTVLAAACALAVGAATGRVLLDSMNAADPDVLDVLAANADPAVDEAAAGRGAPDRLVVVVLDGLGEEGFADAVRGTELASFQWKATVDVGTPSLSRAVYHVLLTGVPQEVSGIRNNTHSGRARADDLAARVRESGGNVGWALETVPWFHDLFGAPGDAYERLGDEPRWNTVTDRFDGPPRPATERYDAMERVLDSGVRLAVLHFTGIDHAGHHRGATSPQYQAAAAEAIGTVAALRDRAPPESGRTVWMIGSDHGHLPKGGHGGPEAEVRRTTWVGLWPSPIPAGGSGRALAPVEIPGVVPAERLASTFAAILGVPAPREALGEPLPLPDRDVAPTSVMRARRDAVGKALAESERAAHTAVLGRAAVMLAALLGIGAVLVRSGKRIEQAAASKERKEQAALKERTAALKERTATLKERTAALKERTAALKERTATLKERTAALGGALLPIAGACLGFWALGPGLTLSAIRTHFAFVSQSLAATALGAAAALPLARRWRTPATWLFAAAAALPAAALAITAGSMGRSRLPDSLSLLFPATGIVPWGVVLGAGAVRILAALACRRRDRRCTKGATGEPPLRNS